MAKLGQEKSVTNLHGNCPHFQIKRNYICTFDFFFPLSQSLMSAVDCRFNFLFIVAFFRYAS